MPQHPKDRRGPHGGGRHQNRSSQQGPPISDIHSPYYFAPLEDEVWRPDDCVSHDIPFSDGISGTLDIEIQAMRPLYIRGTAKRPDQDLSKFGPGGKASAEEQQQFKRWTEPYRLNDDGPYAIPGSSLRGVIRSVLKIISYGSMRHTDDTRISMRDLQMAEYQNEMTDKDDNRGYLPKTQSGWLRERRDGGWELIPCESARVEQELIEESLHKKVLLGDDFKDNSIEKKYRLLSTDKNSHPVKSVMFESEGILSSHRHSSPRPLVYDSVYSIQVTDESANGSLVLTGQPSARKSRENAYNNKNGKQGTRGKHMEFVFHSPSLADLQSMPDSQQILNIHPSVVSDFLTTHHSESKEVESWKFWKPYLKNGEWIPVFYLADGHFIWALGLAQMFRLPGLRATHDGLPPSHRETRPDFTDLLLGCIGEKSLAGRVSFGAAIIKDSQVKAREQALWRVLGSPRPSYYPNYLVQKSQQNSSRLKNNEYSTYLSKEIRLKGWKRYAVRPDVAADDQQVYEDPALTQANQVTNYKSATAFRPLPAGSSFQGTIRFHNLRPHELGALIWALTWGDHAELRHSIGMAKPLGFGSSRISIVGGLDTTLNDFQERDITLRECMKQFVAKMEQIFPHWRSSASIAELTALADPRLAAKVEHLLDYPKLVVGKENDFTAAKKKDNRLILPDYRVRVGSKTSNTKQEWVEPRTLQRSTNHQEMPFENSMPNIPALPVGSPPLERGMELEGVLVLVGNRMKFLPDGYPEREIGRIIGLSRDAIAGTRWRATVDIPNPQGNLFKNPIPI